VHASAPAVHGTGLALDAYAQFRAAVAQAQLTRWLGELASPDGEVATLVDISGPDAFAAEFAAGSGHAVLRVLPSAASATQAPGTQASTTQAPGMKADGIKADGTKAPGVKADGMRPPGRVKSSKSPKSPERLGLVAGDPSGLEFLADGCADGVLAEDGTLSRNLAAETLVSEIARVLRPGGIVLACVDNLTIGMAALAQQSAWPNLADLPHADVVLVPWPDGRITRCYGAEQLRELFTAGGFDVSWIRPRTMFAPRTVSFLLSRDPRSFQQLLHAELRSRPDDSVGDQLIVSARKR
jgi:hypothetical protein